MDAADLRAIEDYIKSKKLHLMVYRIESMIAHGIEARAQDASRNTFADICALYTRALGTVRELKVLYGSEDKPAAGTGTSCMSSHRVKGVVLAVTWKPVVLPFWGRFGSGWRRGADSGARPSRNCVPCGQRADLHCVPVLPSGSVNGGHCQGTADPACDERRVCVPVRESAAVRDVGLGVTAMSFCFSLCSGPRPRHCLMKRRPRRDVPWTRPRPSSSSQAAPWRLRKPLPSRHWRCAVVWVTRLPCVSTLVSNPGLAGLLRVIQRLLKDAATEGALAHAKVSSR